MTDLAEHVARECLFVFDRLNQQELLGVEYVILGDGSSRALTFYMDVNGLKTVGNYSKATHNIRKTTHFYPKDNIWLYVIYQHSCFCPRLAKGVVLYRRTNKILREVGTTVEHVAR